MEQQRQLQHVQQVQQIPTAVHIRNINSAILDDKNVKKERPVRGFRTYYYTVPDDNASDVSIKSKSSSRRKSYTKPSVFEQNRRSNMIIAEILDRKKPPAPMKAFYEPLQLLPDKKGTLQENLMMSCLDRKTYLKDYRMANEPTRMHTVCLPRKGQIKLTSMAYELNNPDYYDDRQKKPPPAVQWDHTKFHLKGCQRQGPSSSFGRSEKPGEAPRYTLWFSPSCTVIRCIPRSADQK